MNSQEKINSVLAKNFEEQLCDYGYLDSDIIAIHLWYMVETFPNVTEKDLKEALWSYVKEKFEKIKVKKSERSGGGD